MFPKVTIVGAGLAGSEAAWQLASRGVPVLLYEMKPQTFSPAHKSPDFAELVCSNSFGSYREESGSGMLNVEATRLGSFILKVARAHKVPAGRSLAVDRERFAQAVTHALEAHPLVEIRREEVLAIPPASPDAPVMIATGPLTGSALAEEIQAKVGTSLYFYDAISPVVLGESINRDVAFLANRWEDGEGHYLNCPLSEAEYRTFIEALLAAETYPAHPFEVEKLFHGCQPIEAMAATGFQTLSFGPMKPVGLVDPRTGTRPYAVVQLRQEDKEGQLWNIVGFQTKMRRGDQTRVLRLIPGLESAEFLRFGSIHRNTYLNAPQLLTERLTLKEHPGLYFAGQITGVEGYLESTTCGLLTALNLYGALTGAEFPLPPPELMLGGLMRYLRESSAKDFQPMNSNFGLLSPLQRTRRMKKQERRQAQFARGAEALDGWIASLPEGLLPPELAAPMAPELPEASPPSPSEAAATPPPALS